MEDGQARVQSLGKELRMAQRRAEMAHERAAQLQDLLVALPQGVLIHAHDKTLFANQAVADIFGYSTAGELLAFEVAALIAPHDRDRLQRAFAASLQGVEAPMHLEHPGIRQNGTLVWVEHQLRLVTWQGERALCSTIRDISSEKQAAEAGAALAHVGRDLAGVLEVGQIAEMVVSTVLRLFQVHRVALFEYDRRRDMLVCHAAAGAGSPEKWSGCAMPSSIGITGRVAMTGQAEQSPNMLLAPDLVVPPWAYHLLMEDGYHAAICVPLLSQGTVLGVLFLGAVTGCVFTEAEGEILAAFAEQTVAALESARRHQEVARRLHQLHSLTSLNQRISSSLRLDEVLQEIARAAAMLLEAPVASFWTVDEATRTLEFHSCSHERMGADWPIAWLPFGQGGAGWVALHRTVLNVPDVFADERIVARHWFRAHGLRSILLVPILLGETLLAILALARELPFTLSAEAHYVLENLSAQAAVAIRNAHLYKKSEDQRRQLTNLVDVAQRLTRGLKLSSVLQGIVEAAALIFEGEASLRLLAGAHLVRVAATPGIIAKIAPAQVPIGRSLCGYVATTGHPLTTADMTTDARLFTDVRTALRGEWLRALLCVPVRLGTRVLGTLQIYREQGYHFEQTAIVLAMSLADQAAIAMENARLFQETQHHAAQLAHTNAALEGEMAERQRTEAALRESEARYRTLVEGSIQGMLIHQDGKNQFANTAMAHILGYTSSDELIGQNSQDHIALSERPRLLHYSNALLRGEPAPSPYTFQGIHKAGTSLWLECLPSVVSWNGRPALLATYVDITERRRLEGQLRQAQKMEALGTLAGGIAHDFNNILAAILGYAELMTFDIEPGTVVWQNLQQVLIAGGRAKQLIQQILAFSRHSDQSRQPVQLSLLMEETLTLLRASLPSTVVLRQSFQRTPGLVMADPTHLQQVVMNLCTNAEHAMRPHGGQLDIELESAVVDAALASSVPALVPGRYLRLIVRDTGHGMTPEVLERIFDPFFTTKSPEEGTGMGLAVVHGIVTGYAGAITVASTPGAGTTFTLYLPQMAHEASATAVSHAALPKGRGRILFVDDEASLVHLAQAMLTRLGYETEVYTHSREALAAFQAAPQHFDLVITDHTMPHLTGEALAKALRQIRGDIPIILYTGFSHTMTEDKAVALGIDAFLMKPLVMHDLGLAIQRVLTARRTSAGATASPGL